MFGFFLHLQVLSGLNSLAEAKVGGEGLRTRTPLISNGAIAVTPACTLDLLPFCPRCDGEENGKGRQIEIVSRKLTESGPLQETGKGEKKRQIRKERGGGAFPREDLCEIRHNSCFSQQTTSHYYPGPNYYPSVKN